MTLKVYNTMTGQKETLIPKKSGEIGMYVCGPTTYNFIHLGNARPLVVFDMVRRYLEYAGYRVTYVSNFTDIDDKIINRAREEGDDPLALSARYIEEYHKDAEALGTLRPTVQPKVTEHIPEIISLIETLVAKGIGYPVDGDVYYDVTRFADYGKLSGRNLEDMQAGARVEVDERKRSPMDFALWKGAKAGEPSWESPWGAGRPGWHIECSAMALKYLGETFDIHGGGFDLIFPHHENEIAQSEAATGADTFARYWMHNGFITINQEKMSKSLGNFFTVREILAKFPGDVVRFFLLSTHYRSPLDFDDNRLEEGVKGLGRLRNAFVAGKEALAGIAAGQRDSSPAGVRLEEAVAKAKRAFEEAMEDDFNSALAIAALFDLARETNTFLSDRAKGEDLAALESLVQFVEKAGDVLGIPLTSMPEAAVDDALLGGLKQLLVSLGQGSEGAADADGMMGSILTLRQEARKNKQWAVADQIRDGLKALGIVVEDTPQGAKWKRA